MDKGIVSLVVFTVLCQSATGFFIAREILVLSGIEPFNDRTIRIFTLLATGVLLLMAIISAFFHLGRPLNAVHFLKNLKSSWLSREIFFFTLFSTVVVFYLIAEKYFCDIPMYIFSVSGLVASAGLISSMSGIYMLKAVPTWNNPGTPVSFIMTAVTCGLPLLLLFPLKEQTTGFVRQLTALFIIFSFLTGVYFQNIFQPEFLLPALVRFSAGLLAVFILISVHLNIFPNKMPSLTVLILLIFIYEMTGRYIFFLNYYKAGL